MDHVIYEPPVQQSEKTNRYYWAVWKGLPELEFEPVKSRGGLDSLMYDGKGIYIWVPNEALKAHRENPNTVYMVLMKRLSTGKTETVWLEPAESNNLDAVRNATRLNSSIMRTKERGIK